MNTETFYKQLQTEFTNATKQGRSHVDINSGGLHRTVGGYPGTDHRMATCCNVMHGEVQPGDRVITEPPQGKGASLTIRYKLPR